jgi:hypothetical protein
VFEGFTLENVDVGEMTLRVRHGGDGQSAGSAQVVGC